MCGIVGYIGNQKAKPILINGLLRLEYRGYDSAGIATIEKIVKNTNENETENITENRTENIAENGIKTVKENTKIKNIKNKGRVNDLLSIDEINSLEGTIGIGHTRWATHGKPSSTNSHPHMDNSNTFAVVHNGIIENYAELRKDLENKGYHFLSETDTEVIPNYIHYFFNNSNEIGDRKFLSAVNETCKILKGSFALEILCSLYPDKMLVVRKDSPLVIGTSKTENFISSDIPAILSFTKDFYLLNDMEFAYLSRDNVNFFNINLEPIQKLPVSIDWGAAAAEKDGYEDFMLKEIYEQPKSIRETIGSRLNNDSKCILDGLELSKEFLENINKIYIVACGTAMHAGLTAKTILEHFCEIPTEVDVASEFRYRNPLLNEKTLCIYISQSGETADTIAALKLAKEKGSKTIAISNVIGSSITREADYTVYTHAGPEIAVASTKAYTAQIVLLSIMAIYFAETLGKNLDKVEKLKKELLELPSKVEETLKLADKVKAFAHKVYNEKDIFFLGRGIDYSASLEASLKLKEISYIHSDAYASGELKHGPIALIENGITVVSILTVPSLIEKSVSNIQEVITRGAKTLIITNQNLGDKKFDEIIQIPNCSEYISPIISIIPLQLFAYYISKEKGLDVDKPRNLAKSVTVE